MALRPTSKAGLPKPRVKDPVIQKSFDAVIERIEVLDGLRGDILDKAVTFRDLADSGFSLYGRSGGVPQIINTPGPGTGGDGTPIPTDGPPSGPPTGLAANETFLAILLTWINPSYNVQFIEVWRSATDNLSLAVRIGTSITNRYLDYVGGSASYYYWVRAVGTDGSYSAFNDTAGVLGTTGIDPASFEFNLNISASNLDAALAARIDLIDVDGAQDSLLTRVSAAEGTIVALDSRTDLLETSVTGLGTTVSGQQTSIDANASALTSVQTSVTTLEGELSTLEGSVLTNASNIIINSNAITSLEATLGTLGGDGELYEFQSSDNGWTAVNGTLVTQADSIIFTPTAANARMESPTISVNGGLFTQVVVRIRQTIGGGTWEGNCFYTTAGHGVSSSFRKAIPDPSLPLNTWKILTWDMTNLTVGDNDWVNSIITKIRFDFVSDGAGKFEIDWITIARFSSTAVSTALSALDSRVGVVEGSIVSQGSRVTSLESTVNNPTTGVAAIASAVSGLTTDVSSNTSDILANAADITALQSTVNNPTTGVAATAAAVSALDTEVTSIDGVVTAQASSITQLSAGVVGTSSAGTTSLVNPLTQLNENYGSTFSAAEIQPYTDVGNRSGVGARLQTNANEVRYVSGSGGNGSASDRIKIEPTGIYEVRFSAFHNKPGAATASFYFGMHAFQAASGGAIQIATPIRLGALATPTSNAYWGSATEVGITNNVWLDVSCYILGAEADIADCPPLRVNGKTADSAVATYINSIRNQGIKVDASAPYVRLRFLNYNASPTYGNDNTTTLYLTNLVVRRIDGTGSSDLFGVIEEQASITASDIGDLNALYAVKIQLDGPSTPYVVGFGLAADVIADAADGGNRVTSAFEVRADQFFIRSPTVSGQTITPFSVDTTTNTVGIEGSLIVKESIRATSIKAGDIGADRISVANLSAFSANMGVLQSGRLTTGTDGTPPLYNDQSSFRVEIENIIGSNYPMWYGSGAKSAGTGLFYVDKFGSVVLKGLLSAGIIEQTLFAPPTTANNPFRIAVGYTPGSIATNYSGKQATILPMISKNADLSRNITSTATPYYTSSIRLYSPTHTGNQKYGRLGVMQELFLVTFNSAAEKTFPANPIQGQSNQFYAQFQYRYDTGTWFAAFQRIAKFSTVQTNGSTQSNHLGWSTVVASRATPAWTILDLRVMIVTTDPNPVFLRSYSFTVSAPNFGYGDTTLNTITPSTAGSLSTPGITTENGILQ